MATSIRDIKQKVVATKKTSQITNAMNMVSASKLKGAQRATENFRPYMDRIEDIIVNLASSGDEIDHPLLKAREVKKVCYILVTSDRGLAGPFNSNLCKIITNEVANKEYIIGTMGIKGYFYCKHKKYNMFDDIVRLPDDVTFDYVFPMIRKVVEMYLNGEVDQVVMVYNHFRNTLSIEPTLKTILPIQNDFQTKNDKKETNQIYDYEGGINSILDTVLPLYIENLVYGVILDSKASEHASRMTAMKNATDNAKDVISQLELKYNRARQSAITLELTDIIGGANAANGGN